MVNALNTAAWGGVYATSLYGAGKVVGSLAKTIYELSQFVWTGVGSSKWDLETLKGRVKDNFSQLLEGLKWVAAGLLVRQLVAYLFTPVAPAMVTKGLELLGWQHVRSPVVDFVASRLPFNASTYIK